MYVVVMQLRGQRTSLFTSIGKGIGSVGYAILTTILVGLGIGLGAILLIVPGIILSCYWFVAIPASAIERVGPVTAINRSVTLTQGYRWQIFGLAVIFVLTGLGIGFALGKLIPPPTTITIESIKAYYQTIIIGQYVLTIPLAIVQSIAAGYAYYILSIEKDGIDVDDIAKVFE